VKGICRLCGTDGELELSHILPKFIFRWIMKTSATGRLRGMGNPNVPVQDGKKIYLLCSSCEDKFSKYETWFANNMFHKAVQGNVDSYEYDNNLFKFVVSIFWRVVIININRSVYDKTVMKNNLVQCEKELSDILNNNIFSHNKDIFILPTSYVNNAPKELRGLNYYFTRTTDVQILFDDEKGKMFFYCVMPFFIIVGNMVGMDKSNFVNCIVNDEGGLLTPRFVIVKDEGVAGFMQSQIARIDKLDISDVQRNAINDRAMKDMDKFLKSSSFKATFMDYLRNS
jgi:hypothetical protein